MCEGKTQWGSESDSLYCLYENVNKSLTSDDMRKTQTDERALNYFVINNFIMSEKIKVHVWVFLIYIFPLALALVGEMDLGIFVAREAMQTRFSCTSLAGGGWKDVREVDGVCAGVH